jgi:hypothetical protein
MRRYETVTSTSFELCCDGGPYLSTRILFARNNRSIAPSNRLALIPAASGILAKTAGAKDGLRFW